METVDIPALLREYESACENRETDARNQGTWDRLNKARSALSAGVETIRKSERYAWKNTHNLDAERMKFRRALEELHAKLGGKKELMRSELIEFIDLALGPESPDSASGEPR